MRKPVKNLHPETVTAEPRHFDFGEGYAERWDVILSRKIQEAIDEGEDDLDNYAPMMNYWYPLPQQFRDDLSLEEAADILARSHCNLTLVQDLETEEYGLALTGGGMDLSWEICEGHMLLGYLPPAHFCHLPNLAGMRLNTRNKWIIAGCRRSLIMLTRDAAWNLKRLRDTRRNLKENTPRTETKS